MKQIIKKILKESTLEKIIAKYIPATNDIITSDKIDDLMYDTYRMGKYFGGEGKVFNTLFKVLDSRVKIEPYTDFKKDGNTGWSITGQHQFFKHYAKETELYMIYVDGNLVMCIGEHGANTLVGYHYQSVLEFTSIAVEGNNIQFGELKRFRFNKQKHSHKYM